MVRHARVLFMLAVTGMAVLVLLLCTVGCAFGVKRGIYSDRRDRRDRSLRLAPTSRSSVSFATSMRAHDITTRISG